MLNGAEDLLEIMGLEVTMQDVRAGTHSESWRKRVLYCTSNDAETAGAK